MTQKPILVCSNPDIKPSTWKPAEASPLDIALTHGYLRDVLAVIISPSNGASAHPFHLTLKSELSIDPKPVWINDFGPKEYLAGRAVEAIDLVLKHAPERRLELMQWKSDLAGFSWSDRHLLMLPE